MKMLEAARPSHSGPSARLACRLATEVQTVHCLTGLSIQY